MKTSTASSSQKSMLGHAIQAAKSEQAKQDDLLSGLPESSNTRKPDLGNLAEEQVNLSIRVGKRERLHWLLEAKKQGTSLTEAITKALNTRFGEVAQE